MAETDSVPAASAALVRELARVQRLHAERAGNPILAGSLERVANWQARRLRMTYADLAADARYAAAIEFFQNDLYGPGDFSRRDADLARVVPMMVKVLPERVIATVAAAMELNALSQELDRVLLARLPRADGHFTVLEYCKAYRRAGNFPLRRRQIKLIGEIGTALDQLCRQAADAHGARDDAAAGAARGPVGACRISSSAASRRFARWAAPTSSCARSKRARRRSWRRSSAARRIRFPIRCCSASHRRRAARETRSASAQQLVELRVDFALDRRLQHRQQQAQAARRARSGPCRRACVR